MAKDREDVPVDFTQSREVCEALDNVRIAELYAERCVHDF